jgi:transposase InsO family protein
MDDVFRADADTVIRTTPYTPVANADAERWVGTVRRELLDRTLIWSRRQLDYVEPYNTHRPHRVLGQRAPDSSEIVAYPPPRPTRQA